MKKRLTILRFIAMSAVFAVIAIVFSLNLTSCKKDEVNTNPTEIEIKLRLDTLFLLKNKTERLNFDFLPHNVEIPELKWNSSDKTIATVDKNGNVTAKDKIGKCTITISTADDKFSDNCIVIVSAQASRIMIKTPLSIFVGAEPYYTFTASVLPSDANQSVEWSSSDTKVATIDKDGKLTPIKEGTTTITAKSKVNPSIQDTKTIKVLLPKVILKPSECSLFVGKTETLSATVFPSSANKNIEWSSSDSKIATVDANGTVKAIKVGGPISIIATSKAHPSSKDTCKITVESSKVTLNYSTYKLLVGKTVKLTAKIEPSDISQTVEWSSSNSSIATVDANGTVKAIKDGGPVTITATSKADPDSKAKCIITIEPIVIDLNIRKYTTIKNETIKLTATVIPSDADQSVTWSSSRPDIAKVAQNGTVATVTTLANGTAIITATSKVDKTSKASCTIKVEPLEVKLDTKCIFLTPNGTYTLKATISPASCSNKILEWSSSDSKVATVNNYCLVRGIKDGAVATISVKYQSTIYASCMVQVRSKSIYTKGNYYQWDAYASFNNTDNGWKKNSSGFHPGANVKAEQSCKNCITEDQMRMYLGAGVYFDYDGPATQLPDGDMVTKGLWIKRSTNINGFKNSTAKKVDRASLENGLFKQGRPEPEEIHKYFFLPAIGYYGYSTSGSLYYSQYGYDNLYWLSTIDASIDYQAKVLRFGGTSARVTAEKRKYGCPTFSIQ